MPITNVCKQKPYNEIHAEQVPGFIRKTFGIEFREHLVIKNIEEDDFGKFHDLNIRMLYDAKLIDEHFIAITNFPPNGAMDMAGTNEIAGLDRSRIPKSTREGRSNRPFYNLDKAGIAELYHKFDLMGTLFPLTRSCEAYTHDFSKHCGKCWWCRERQWVFGRLD